MLWTNSGRLSLVSNGVLNKFNIQHSKIADLAKKYAIDACCWAWHVAILQSQEITTRFETNYTASGANVCWHIFPLLADRRPAPKSDHQCLAVTAQTRTYPLPSGEWGRWCECELHPLIYSRLIKSSPNILKENGREKCRKRAAKWIRIENKEVC